MESRAAQTVVRTLSLHDALPISDSESTTWRTAAEFIIEPGGGHEVQLGSGYGTRLFQPLEIGRAHAELQSRGHLVCRLLLEKKNGGRQRQRGPRRGRDLQVTMAV